ncbi:MAG TPA: GNAT family protein [Micromonosporaceae bacterium]|nr:GNAT family protein [Micromonosporaceae bacterium]
MTHPGWPVVLSDGPVVLRPYRRTDIHEWVAVRRFNENWLAHWEPTPYGSWRTLNSPAAFRAVYADMRRSGRDGTSMPFAICLWSPDGQQRLVGQLTLSNIVRRAFCSAYAGYWVDSRVAGRGIMPTALALAVDHAFSSGGLHRIEVNIRPENAASRRVVEKLGFRQEAYHHRYLHIDGDWRDHLGYAVTAEDLIGDGGLVARWHRTRAAA